MRWRSHDRRRAATAVLCVVALHGALVWGWQDALTGPTRQSGLTPPLRVTLRLVPLRPTPAALQRRPETPLATATLRKPLAMPSRPRQPPSTGETSTAAAAPDRAVITTTPAEGALRPAIRASARTPSLSALAAAASEEPRPVSAQERLGDGVKSAGKGDCLKGQYAGAGMGILSLPFIALAAARGACAQ